MMKSFAKAAAVAALIVAGAVGTTTATTSAASAGEFSFRVIVGDGYPPVYRDYGHRRHWRACSPGTALHKARRLGIHRAYVSRVGRNRIVVRGHRHGRNQRAVFANRPYCPVIAYRR